MGTKVQVTAQTPKGDFGYSYLDKPDSSPRGKNKFKATLLLEMGVKANDEFAEKFNALHRSVKGKRDKLPVKDGNRYIEDADDAEQAKKREWARDKWIVVAKTKEKPTVYAANGKSRLAVPPSRGDFGRIMVYATDYDVDGSQGVSFYLNGVQLLERRAAPMDGGGFDDESGEYGDDTAAAPTKDTREDDGEDGDSRPAPTDDGGDGDY